MKKEKVQQNVSDKMVVFTACIGMFLSTLDTGIINVALPTLTKSFHESITFITWTITLYTLALVGSIILFGRLSDKYGSLKIYALGLLLFLVTSILCGFSRSIGELIVCRTFQGIAAAMLQATATAIITTTIPKERLGVALGTLSMSIGLGPILGPSVGGLLLSLGSWRWIFWINVPFVLAGLIGCSFLVDRVKDSKQDMEIDWFGNGLLIFSMVALLQGISMLATDLISFKTVGALSLFIVLFTGFVFWECREKHPLVDMKLFRNGTFTASILGIFVIGGATSLGFMIPPYFLEKVSKLDPWQAGLVNLSAPLGLVLMSKQSGRLIEKVGTTRLMIIGLVIMTITYGILSFMQSGWNPVFVGILLLLYGFGAGFFIPSNTARIMGAVCKEIQGTIGAVQRMVQNLGIALFASIASSFIRFHSQAGLNQLMKGFREAWLFATVMLWCSLFVLMWSGKNRLSKI